MIIVNPLDLVRHHQRASAGRILGGHPGRTAVGMTRQRLDAAQREHEAGAELHQSAPIAIARAMSKAVAIFPAAPMRMRSRALMPINALWTKLTPSRIGMPIWSMNSSGAAPVPPSLPSTTIKSE